MGGPDEQSDEGVPRPSGPLIASVERFIAWAEAIYREGRDHSGDFRKSIGLPRHDLSNWKSALWRGKNAWSRQIAVTERLLATLTYDGVHPAYKTKGQPKNVRGSDWSSYAHAQRAPNRTTWDEVSSETIRQVEQYYSQLVEAHKESELRNALRDVRRGDVASDEQATFVRALTRYVAFLVRQGKMKTVLEIRESMSHLLHLLGENGTRFQVGEFALMAAVASNSTLDRAQILIDDLGWAAFLLKDHSTARENIQDGIRIANSHQTSNISDLIEARLTSAKGYRHLAMMAEDEKVGHQYLTQAEQVIQGLNTTGPNVDHFKDAITRDKAQIDHARATIIARSLGILESGTISIDDRESSDRATRR